MIVETQKAEQAIFILCVAYAMRTINCASYYGLYIV